MSPIILGAVFLVALAIAVYVQSKKRYYDKVFSDEHYTEIVHWLHSVLNRGAVAEPRAEDGTALYSSAECTFTFTRDIEDGKDILHIAISQMRPPTTHAACNRLAFVILQTLEGNKCEGDLYYTETNIHHIILVKDAGTEWKTNDVDFVLSQIKSSYQAPPFHFQSIKDSP